MLTKIEAGRYAARLAISGYAVAERESPIGYYLVIIERGEEIAIIFDRQDADEAVLVLAA